MSYDICLKCGRRSISCVCKPGASGASNSSAQKKAAVRVQLSSKGRGGKQVTVITGLPLDDVGLRTLGTELKQLCGTGGTVKDGCIEIQGDWRDRIITVLQSKGFAAKKSGG